MEKTITMTQKLQEQIGIEELEDLPKYIRQELGPREPENRLTKDLLFGPYDDLLYRMEKGLVEDPKYIFQLPGADFGSWDHGTTSILVGPGAVGKTNAALWLVVMAILGNKWLEYEVHLPEGKIVYLSTEESERILKKRVEALFRVHNVSEEDKVKIRKRLVLVCLKDDDTMLYGPYEAVIDGDIVPVTGTTPTYDKLLNSLDSLKEGNNSVSLVVFDVAHDLHAVNENDNMQMRRFIRSIDQSGPWAKLLLWHTPKGGINQDVEMTMDMVRGASSVGQRVKYIMSVRGTSKKLDGAEDMSKGSVVHFLVVKDNEAPIDEAGYYAVRSDDKGIPYMPGTPIRAKKDVDKEAWELRILREVEAKPGLWIPGRLAQHLEDTDPFCAGATDKKKKQAIENKIKHMVEKAATLRLSWKPADKKKWKEAHLGENLPGRCNGVLFKGKF